jgi:hypothetical protein
MSDKPITRLVTSRFGRKSAAAAAIALAMVSAAAVAQQAMDLMPAAGEVRLTLKMGARDVAFPAKIAPIVRESIPFEERGHAVTAEGREAMIRLQEALFRQPGGSLVLIVYGEDETLAFQRAKAVRGELAERHSMDAGRIIATGRKAEGHGGDLAVVDVYSADPTRCGGCGSSTFRTVALDSATMQLVTVTPEAIPAATAKPARPAPIAAAPKPAPAVQRPVAATPAPVLQAQAAAAPAPVRQRPEAGRSASDCPRPRIIIDDYYPGGPIVPCRPLR